MQYRFKRFKYVLLKLAIAPLLLGASCAAFSQQSVSNSTLLASTYAPGEILRVGQVVERDVKAGEIQRFTITLQAGEYFKLQIQSLPETLSLGITSPTGQVVGAFAAQRLNNALWVPASPPGDYQVEIKLVPSVQADQPYRILFDKLGRLEAASSSEQLYLRGHSSYWEGGRLLHSRDDNALTEATRKYEVALEAWRQLNERVGEAFTLQQLAFVYDRRRNPDTAIVFFKQALEISRAIKASGLEADIVYNLGSLYASIGRANDAVSSYKQAIDLGRRNHNDGALAFALNNLGQAYLNIGEYQAALEAYQESLLLRRQLGDVEGQARGLSNISGVYFRLSEFQEALNYCLQALPLRAAAGDRRGQAITLNNIGSIYRELGEPQQAIEHSRRALALMRELGVPQTEAVMLDGLARSYYELGDYKAALDYHTQALALKPVDAYVAASMLTNIGNAYRRLEDRGNALKYFDQALESQRKIKDRRGEAVTLQSAAELFEESKQFPKAREYFDAALTICRDIKNRICEANALYGISRIEKAGGDLANARAHVEAAIAIVESSRTTVSGNELRASFLGSKQGLYELYIELLMQLDRRDKDSKSSALAFSVSEQRRARSLLDSLHESRSRIHRGISPDLLKREHELRAKLNHYAENQIKLLSGTHTTEQAVASTNKVNAVAAEYEQLLSQIRQSSPLYASLTQPAPLTLEETQKELLDPDTILLEYSLGKERSYLWAVTAAEVVTYELPGKTVIENKARDVYSLLTARNRFVKFEKPEERQNRIAQADEDYFKAASELSLILLGDVAPRLHGKRLIIVADGALHYIPFSALPIPAQPQSRTQLATKAFEPLIVSHDVVNLPSASILSLLRQTERTRRPAPQSVAVLADPVFSKSDARVSGLERTRRETSRKTRSVAKLAFDAELVRAVNSADLDETLDIPRLPSTRDEARAIVQNVARTRRFEALDFDASRATATNPMLSKYRIVHFATHGLVNSEHPGLSGLVLSLVDKRGHDQDGFLTAYEIFDIDLPADLVVLSGCRTGLGKEIKGEGIMGLTRAFMYAGATRTAVSLWDVHDKSTSELMARFYDSMLLHKHPPANALREAQVTMWRSTRWKAPYYWAGFILQGEYR